MPTLNSRSTSIHLQQAAILTLIISISACQPADETPGFWLNGEVVEHTVDDWTFTNSVEEIFIQTKTWYLLPHSTTIWCGEMSGELYVGSYADEQKYWESNVLLNPDARLQINGLLYDVSVTPVSDTLAIANLDVRYAAKYNMAEVFGENLPQWRYYRVSQHN